MNKRKKRFWLIPVLALLIGGIVVSILHSAAQPKSVDSGIRFNPTPTPTTSQSTLEIGKTNPEPTQIPSTPHSSAKAIKKATASMKPSKVKAVATNTIVTVAPSAPSARKVSIPTRKPTSIPSTAPSHTSASHKPVVANPSPTAPLYPAYGGTIITNAPDWNGFVAPKASFAGVLSCKKSTVLMQNWFGGEWGYPYLVTERWKLTDGNFIVGNSLTHYTPSDTYYVTFTDEPFFTTNMNLVSTSPDDFIFRPFNWKGVNSSWAADTADTGRDISYDVTSTYTQAECQG